MAASRTWLPSSWSLTKPMALFGSTRSEKSTLVKSGTHDALVAHNGGYATLWRLQTGEHKG